MKAELLHKTFDPFYYYRDINHDIETKKDDQLIVKTAKRAIKIVVPFLTLYKPFGYFLSVSMGTVRSVTDLTALSSWEGAVDLTQKTVELSLSILSLLGAALSFRLGILITSGSDILIDGKNFISHACHYNANGAKASGLSLLNHSFYLSILLTGSIEVILASFLMQAANAFYKAKNEEAYPEIFAHFLMGVIRLNQARYQIGRIQRRNYLLSFKRYQNLKQKVEMGRDIAHLQSHPLSDLTKVIQERKVLFQDHDFGAHIHGLGQDTVKGMNFCLKNKEVGAASVTEISFKLNHVHRDEISQTIEQIKGFKKEEVRELFSLLSSHAKDLTFSETVFYSPDTPLIGPAFEVTVGNIGKLFIGSDSDIPNMYDKVVIHLNEGKNLYDLHEMLTFLDLDSILHQSTKDMFERMKLGQLFRTFYPEKAFHLERSKDFFSLSLEELKKQMIELAPDIEERMEKYLPRMVLREILPGRLRYSIDGLSDELPALGLTSAVTGAYSEEELFPRVAAILEMGLLSSEMRFTNGLTEQGLSAFMDLETGAFDSVFTQLIPESMEQEHFTELMYHSPIRFCFSPKVLETLTYQYHDDNFGIRITDPWGWWDTSYEERPDIFTFAQDENKNFQFDNEVMVKERIDPSYITHIVVQSQETKDSLIEYLRKKNIFETLNLNHLIQVTNTIQSTLFH